MKNDEKKQIYKKWWFWVSIILIVSVCVTIVHIYNNNNTTFNNYKKQSITILTQYKDGKLTRKETEEKIDAMADKLQSEYKVNNEINISYLQVQLSLIVLKLFDGELSNTEIDGYIQEIEKID